jgi:hypothetical protein
MHQQHLDLKSSMSCDLKPCSQLIPHRWCLHLIVVMGFECSRDPESSAGGSVAIGSVIHAGQVKGSEPDEEGYPGPPGLGVGREANNLTP